MAPWEDGMESAPPEAVLPNAHVPNLHAAVNGGQTAVAGVMDDDEM